MKGFSSPIPIVTLLFSISRFTEIVLVDVVNSAKLKLTSLIKFNILPEFKNQISFRIVVLLDPFLPVNKFKSE